MFIKAKTFNLKESYESLRVKGLKFNNVESDYIWLWINQFPNKKELLKFINGKLVLKENNELIMIHKPYTICIYPYNQIRVSKKELMEYIKCHFIEA